MGRTHGFEEDQIRRIWENLQFGGRLEYGDKRKKAYAAYYDNDIRMKSSSGAIFSLLANEVLEKKGIVYGVAMNASCTEAEYIGVTEKQDLEKLLGSKYLQAKIKNIFKNVRENLVLNKLVLFTGTGCQINGLKKFLQKDYKNLICVDIICHGVPSPALWKEYVGYMENKMQGKMKKVNFRCKDQGWENFGMKEYGSSKEVYISKSKDPYMQMFLSDFCLRPSCYECKAKTLRLSDLTIGDFWGIDTIAPEMNDSKGTSLVIVRTNQGEKIFNRLISKSSVKVMEVEYDDATKENPAEFRSVYRPKERETFFIDMKKMDFEELRKSYLSLPIKQRIKNAIKKVLKPVLKRARRGGIKSNLDYGMLMQFNMGEKNE